MKADGVKDRESSHIAVQELARADNIDENWKREQSYTPKGHHMFYNTIAAYDTCTAVHADIADDGRSGPLPPSLVGSGVRLGRQEVVDRELPHAHDPVHEYENAVETLRRDIVDMGATATAPSPWSWAA